LEKYRRAGQVADDNITWCMHFASSLIKAMATQFEYVILTSFLLQKWLHERSSMLCFYVICMDKQHSMQILVHVTK